MKVAILHHHFDPGGVTSVVLGHIAGFAKLAPSLRMQDVLLLHGGRAGAIEMSQLSWMQLDMPLKHRAVPELEYDDRTNSNGRTKVTGVLLADSIEKELLAAGFGKDETVIHVHNPTLGKNVALPPALRLLAERGWGMLLQIHDFAEDLRPRNYAALIDAAQCETPVELSNWLYPSGPAIHYATLSTRDLQVLVDRIPNTRLHLVPNPILNNSGPGLDRESARKLIDRVLKLDPKSRYILYPVRGIQRKNLGEILLLSLLLGPSGTFSVTLPPTSPIERASWQRWLNWSRDLQLPIVFGSGLHEDISLAQNRAAADSIITTSVAEGFGLAYLESWLTQRVVVGRDLPGVTDDFRDNGVTLDGLYQRINIPLAKSQKQSALDAIEESYFNAWQSLPSAFRPVRSTENAENVGHLDFAELTPSWQYKVLSRMTFDPGFANACRALNPTVLDSLDSGEDSHLLEDNRRTVMTRYSPVKIAEGLISVYQSILQQPRCIEENGESSPAVIEQLSQAAVYHPLRTELPIGDDPFQRLSRTLEPIPTDTTPRLKPLPGIRAVVFDIYGTLVISGSGDVGTADRTPREAALADALRALAINADVTAQQGIERLHAIISQHQDQARKSGITYPEVDILKVWQHWLDQCVPTWRVEETANTQLFAPLPVRLSEEFEARANPCYAMPDALVVLQKLRDRGLKLGIVSNAQAFTLKMLEAVLDVEFSDLGFEQELCYFSYRFRHGKPSTLLYEKLAEGLERHSISPSETLYIGNDMLNDITAASQRQFRTALFAGDQRSLRWRANDPRVSGVAPDLVITELSQLLTAI